jgi:monoamine oxidase
MIKNLRIYLDRELIQKKIYAVRGKKVMLDRDLAELYGVTTKVLNQAVKRNIYRFPEDFMFRLNSEETQNWRSQFVTSNLNLKIGLRYAPYAFTEQGVAMLSSVLQSKTAIKVNIQIIRTFTKLRELLVTNELVRQKIEDLEKKYEKHDNQFRIVFEAIRELLEIPPTPKKKPIGFHVRY